MPDLNFSVEKASAAPFAAAPMLSFTLRISDADSGAIHAIALRCQIRIEPARRRYEPREEEKLADLFGEPSRWGQTLRPLLWTHAGIVVPPFEGSTTVELPVPCSYDFNLAASKYFYALEDGEVPLNLLFSGTIFHEGEDHRLQIAQISWEKESHFRLPVKTWEEMMRIYYPNTAWLCLGKDAFDALYQYKSSRALPTWEAAIERLIEDSQEKIGT
jgi:uncharacterized protein DUF6084